jgi:hypothetical protein
MNVVFNVHGKVLFGRPRGLSRRLARAALPILIFLNPGVALPAPSNVQTVTVGQVLRGHFVQSRQLAGFAKPLRSEGSFVLVPGSGLIWHGEKPFLSTTVVTPDGVLQIADGQEVTRLPASKLPGLAQLYDVLGAALSGNVAPLKQTFAVADTTGSDKWRIVLTPLHTDGNAAAQLTSLTLEGGQFVDRIEIDKSGGDVDRITFLDQAVMQANLTTDEKALLNTLHR